MSFWTVKNNFLGVENPRLYSETYYGTKHLAQDFIDELEKSLAYLLHSSHLTRSEKFNLAKHLHTNLGRTALCLSGGASFAWYHFGVAKALLDADLLPDVVTGSKQASLWYCVIRYSSNLFRVHQFLESKNGAPSKKKFPSSSIPFFEYFQCNQSKANLPT